MKTTMPKALLSLALLLALLPLSASAQIMIGTTPITINTGYTIGGTAVTPSAAPNEQGAPPAGNPDPNFLIVSTALTGSATNPATTTASLSTPSSAYSPVVIGNTAIGQANLGWVTVSGAQWISPNTNQETAAYSPYGSGTTYSGGDQSGTYEYQVVLEATSNLTLTLSGGSFSADNGSTFSLSLNSTVGGNTVTAGNAIATTTNGFQSVTSIPTATFSLLSGNTVDLDFLVTNSGTSPSPTGLLVENLNITALAAPEPYSLAIGVILVALFGVLRMRARTA